MTAIGTRKLRYPGNDPENGPACWHVWNGARWDEVEKERTFTRKIAEYIADFFEEVRYDYWKHSQGWTDEWENPNLVHVTYTGHVILGIIGHIKFWWNIFHCATFGHDMVDESYGGPDSGCMAASCRRCGHGFHHTLY